MNTLEIPFEMMRRLDALWTFMLLFTRYVGFFYIIPGLGEGAKGITIRLPAVAILSFVSMQTAVYAPPPSDVFVLCATMAMEFLLGTLFGMVPLLIVSGAQTAAQLASTSMGFGAGQLFDPTTGGSVADLGRLLGDLTVILFLLLGGDHVAIHAVSGFAGKLTAGSFMMTDLTVNLFIERTGDIFRVGVLLSAPVIVALLLTQFVMGLVTKAVPTVNIFIVSFPLTIGIGLFLTIAALPDMMQFMVKEISGLDNTFIAITRDAHMVEP